MLWLHITWYKKESYDDENKWNDIFGDENCAPQSVVAPQIYTEYQEGSIHYRPKHAADTKHTLAEFYGFFSSDSFHKRLDFQNFHEREQEECADKNQDSCTRSDSDCIGVLRRSRELRSTSRFHRRDPKWLWRIIQWELCGMQAHPSLCWGAAAIPPGWCTGSSLARSVRRSSRFEVCGEWRFFQRSPQPSRWMRLSRETTNKPENTNHSQLISSNGIRHNSYTITFKENVCMQIVFLCPRLDVVVMFQLYPGGRGNLAFT